MARSLLLQEPALDLFGPSIHGRYFQDLFAASDLDSSEIQRQRASLAYKSVAGQFKLIDDE